MSPDDWQDRIRDILDAISEIGRFIAGMSRDQFLSDAKTLKAVTADLTIIGEASRYVPDNVVATSPEIPWALMRGMRNRIVHAYFHVDPVIVWETCQNDLTALVEPLEKLLRESPEPE